MSNILVQRLATMFGPPEFSGDAPAYIAEIGRLTKSYGQAVLERAADLLIRDHRPSRLKPWPAPAEICQACADAAEAMQPRKTEVSHPEWSRAAVGKAYDLLRSPIGRKAADEGWVLSLWDHCRKQGRLPSPVEAGRLKQTAAQFDAALSRVRSAPHGGNASLVALGESMLTRRQKLADHAHGVDVGRDPIDISSSVRRMTGDRE